MNAIQTIQDWIADARAEIAAGHKALRRRRARGLCDKARNPILQPMRLEPPAFAGLSDEQIHKNITALVTALKSADGDSRLAQLVSLSWLVETLVIRSQRDLELHSSRQLEEAA